MEQIEKSAHSLNAMCTYRRSKRAIRTCTRTGTVPLGLQNTCSNSVLSLPFWRLKVNVIVKWYDKEPANILAY